MSEDSPYSSLSKPWQKFFQKFEEAETIKASTWKEVHALGYICNRFEKLHEQKFAVTIKNAPTKSPDIYMVKRVMAMLNTTDMRVMKEYIDWVYDNRIVPKKVHFKKIGYFATSEFVNDFLFQRKKAKQISRTMEVPENYKEIASQFGIDINTYGDLAFLKLSVDRGSDKTGTHSVLLGNLEALGLDINQLKELK